MKFSDLDKQMRIYETAHDICVLPGIYIIARLDGKGFSKLTDKMEFEKPFDLKFSTYMRNVVIDLMLNSGLDIVYGYTQSDEISLLFKHEISAFNRKERKYNSILAGLASAKFSLDTLSRACFDCRIVQIPNYPLVKDYFRWRQEDSCRNCLNSYCYWTLRKNGESINSATEKLENMPNSKKHDLLFSYGINYNDVISWQKRGVGFYFSFVEKIGINPLTNEESLTVRRELNINDNLPYGNEYNLFLDDLENAI